MANEPPLRPPPLHGKCHLKFPFWFFEHLPNWLWLEGSMTPIIILFVFILSMGTLDVHSTRGRHELRSRVQNELGLQGNGSPSSLNINWYENHRQNRQTMHFTWKSSTKQTNNALKVKGFNWGVKAWKKYWRRRLFLAHFNFVPNKKYFLFSLVGPSLRVELDYVCPSVHHHFEADHYRCS